MAFDLRRPWLFVAGIGMATGSALTVEHYFAANFPATIFEGSFCDISAFFNCDSSAFSPISAVSGVPIGTFGFVMAFLVVLSAWFGTPGLVRTTRFLSAANVVGVVALLLYSVFGLGSLCLLCSIYYVFSFLALWATWRGDEAGRFVPSASHLAAAALVTAVVAFSMAEYHDARRSARAGGDALRVTAQFRALPVVPEPSVISPNWVIRASDSLAGAPLRIVAWEDFLCSDCRYFSDQLKRLEPRYAGKMNVVFQHFPLEAACNDVVEKDKHPGACDLSAMALYAPDRFEALYTRVFAEQTAAKAPEWRAAIARELGVEAALTDSTTRARLREIIRTGAEYEKTHEQYANGIRSTPTLLINGRLVIGTFPDDLLRAMLDEALAEAERGEKRFLESWVE